MKHLYVLRHGKSDWSAASQSDFDRPLAPRGVLAAERVGRMLRALDEIPDVVVASAAQRTRATAALAGEAGAWPCEVRVSEGLYLAPLAAMVAAARSIEDASDSALIVGHEPGCSALVGSLIGSVGGSAALRFPTAALARIDLDVASWDDAAPGAGTLEWYVIPRMLESL